MPRVYNKKNGDAPRDAVYIGRPSKWGNPFVIGRDGTREEVIAKYEQYILADTWLLNQMEELVDKDVICWCAPQACHGDVLIRLANEWKNGPTEEEGK